jgi:hypothetical protein
MAKRWVLAALIAAVPVAALAQGDTRPDFGAPFSTEDAFPQRQGQLQLQVTGQYDRTRQGTDGFEPSPGFQWGIAPGVELRLFGDYNFGDSSSANRGTVTPGLFVQLAEERGLLPAFAILGEVEAPVGAGDRGTVTVLTAAASRTTGRGPGSFGLHVNAAWLWRPDPGIEERQNRYRLSGAVSHVVADSTILVAEYVHERQEIGERDLSLVQGGLRRKFGEDTTFGVAVAAGLTDDSPRFRIRLGLEVNVNLTGGR